MSYKEHIDYWLSASGICARCKEHTSVLDSCCGGRVHFEGSTIDSDELLAEVCECDGGGDCPACLYFESST